MDAINSGPMMLKQVNRACTRQSRKNIKTKEDDATRITAYSTYNNAEVKAYSRWINTSLANVPQVKSYLPIDENDPNDFFTKVGDGNVLLRMLQKVSDGLIDERVINVKITHPVHKHENLNLAIGTATAIGCTTTNIHPTFIMDGKPNICLGLTWQIIRAGLFVKISLQENPNLVALAREGEDLNDLLKLSQEELLLRWMNYQLQNNPNYTSKYGDREITNFNKDITDSVGYQYLMEQIQPKGTGLAANSALESEPNYIRRAEETLDMADRLQCKQFVTPESIKNGDTKLNTAFTALLFNTHPNLHADVTDDVDEIKETREEKTYRNFVNSLELGENNNKVNPPAYYRLPMLNHLYTGLLDGIAILLLEDRILKQRGVSGVNWNKVYFPPQSPLFAKTRFLGNCCLAVNVADKQVGCKIVNIEGADIYALNGDLDKNTRRIKEMLSLGVIWQLMRAYTLSLLAQLSNSNRSIENSDVVDWFNAKISAQGHQPVRDFKDDRLKDSTLIQTVLNDLTTIDARDGNEGAPAGNDLVLKATSDPSEKLQNARYVINVARRMGAIVYTLPEDIVEANPKMILCFIVTLMILEQQLLSTDDLEPLE